MMMRLPAVSLWAKPRRGNDEGVCGYGCGLRSGHSPSMSCSKLDLEIVCV